MSSQLLEELDLKAKNRGIKGYESMPINEFLSILDASKPIKNFEDIKPSFTFRNITLEK